jgi:beta-glucuronidase
MSAPRECRLIAICVFAGSITAAAAPSALITDIPGRTSISLDGTWRAIVDRTKRERAALLRKCEAKNPRDLVEYDFDTFGTLNVPGDWNSQRTH